MAFTELVQSARNIGRVRTALISSVRMSFVARKGTGDQKQIAAFVRIPPGIIKELDWRNGDRFDVFKGDGDDAGWYAIKLNQDAKEGGKLMVEPNGVGNLNTVRLVPEGVTQTAPTTSPPSKISDGMLLIKVS